MLLDLCLGFISFDHQREERMPQRLEEADLMESTKLSFPSKDRILGFRKGARGGVEPPPLRACFDHWPDHADRRFQARHEGVFCLGKVGRTVCTLVQDTATMMLRGIGRMSLQDSRGARWALDL
jgi:hypothetical protein